MRHAGAYAELVFHGLSLVPRARGAGLWGAESLFDEARFAATPETDPLRHAASHAGRRVERAG